MPTNDLKLTCTPDYLCLACVGTSFSKRYRINNTARAILKTLFLINYLRIVQPDGNV